MTIQAALSTHETRFIEVYSPSAGKLVRTIPATPISDLPSIVTSSRKAQLTWSRLSLEERSAKLRNVLRFINSDARAIAQAIHQFNGKTESEALIAEVLPTLATFEFFADEAHKHLKPETLHMKANPIAKSRLYYEPLGVIGIISPWNYPFMLALADVPAALMAGNSVIIKMSEYSAAIGELIDSLMKKAGMPDHLVQVIQGFGDLGAALISSGIDKVCFTGSTKTGMIVYQAAATAMIPCSLELGGKDAAIVLDDADLDKTARGLLWGSYANSGQACASIERAFIPSRRRHEFTRRLSELFDQLPESSLGTMNTLFQKDIVLRQINDAKDRGAKVLAERTLTGDSNPFRVAPSIITDIPKDSSLLTDETFGPVLPLIFYDDLEAVIREVNESVYGLTASVWTEDYAKGESIAARIDAGAVTVNDHMITAGMPETPWNGHKLSGLGFSRSYLAFREFSKLKYVYHDHGRLKFKFWQFPFDSEKTEWTLKYLDSRFAQSAVKRIWSTIKTMPKMLFTRDGF